MAEEKITKTPEQIAADNKALSNKTQLPAKDAASEPQDPSKPNLTRDALELQLASRYEAEGKSVEQARALAKKRAIEMIP